MNIIELPKELTELYRFASKDVARRNLQYVQVGLDPTKKSKYAAAVTDGHRLAVWRFDESDIDLDASDDDKEIFRGLLEKGLYLHREDLKTASVGLKKGYNLKLKITKDKMTLINVCKNNEHGITEYDGGVYPDWTQVESNGELGENARVGFNLRYLIDVAEYLKKLDVVPIGQISIKDDLSPALLQPYSDKAAKGQFRYTIMPCRC